MSTATHLPRDKLPLFDVAFSIAAARLLTQTVTPMLDYPIRRRAFLALPAVTLLVSACSTFSGIPRDKLPLTSSALKHLSEIGASAASPMLVRIFKESSELEVWRQSTSGDYQLFCTYRICKWSGTLGPKFAEGDEQAPEGV